MAFHSLGQLLKDAARYRYLRENCRLRYVYSQYDEPQLVCADNDIEEGWRGRLDEKIDGLIERDGLTEGEGL